MKPRSLMLRLLILAGLVLGSAFLLRARNLESARENAHQALSATAAYSESQPLPKPMETKACCEKPPARAALMQSAPTLPTP